MVSTFSVNNFAVAAPVGEVVPATSYSSVSPSLITPDSGNPNLTYPVPKWNGYTYWALSYIDNRVSFALAVYDAVGSILP